MISQDKAADPGPVNASRARLEDLILRNIGEQVDSKNGHKARTRGAVVPRLDRTNQYSRRWMMDRKALGYWALGRGRVMTGNFRISRVRAVGSALAESSALRRQRGVRGDAQHQVEVLHRGARGALAEI